MKLYVGCAMWTHAAWQSRSLGEYAAGLNAVEGNTTFYATPSAKTVASWAEQTSPDFRFLFKLPQTVTHQHRLAGADEAVRGFLAAVAPLGDRARTLWIQLPASFGPDGLGTLAAFLRGLPGEHRYAVEVRHRAFFADQHSARRLEEVLGSAGAEWVVFDTTVLFASSPVTLAEREAVLRKPRLPRRVRALTSCPVVRYIGRDDAAVTAAGWRDWVSVVAGWLREGRSPTVFIHTPANAEAPVLARRFYAEVRECVPELPPLPEPIADEPLTLF